MRGDVPSRVKRMGPGMVASATDEGRVDGLTLTESMRDEHDRLLVEGKVIDTRTGSLNAKVVLVLNIDAPILVLRNLDVVGSSLETVITILGINYAAIGMHNGVHVTGGGMMIIGIDGSTEDDIFELSMLLVNVSDSVRGTGKYNTVNINIIVVLIVDTLLAVRQNNDLANTSVLLQSNAINKLVEDLANTFASILPSNTGGNVAVSITSLGRTLPRILAVGD